MWPPLPHRCKRRQVRSALCNQTQLCGTISWPSITKRLIGNDPDDARLTRQTEQMPCACSSCPTALWNCLDRADICLESALVDARSLEAIHSSSLQSAATSIKLLKQTTIHIQIMQHLPGIRSSPLEVADQPSTSLPARDILAQRERNKTR